MRWKSAAGYAAGIAAATATIWLWPSIRPAFSGTMAAAADLLARTGPWGPLVVIGLQMVSAVVSPLPQWPVTVAAGALYGPLPGTLYALVGGTLGAAINFAIARRVGQPLVRRTLGEKWVQKAATLGPLHFFVLSLFGRLIPIASFDLVAYVAGISGIRLLTFLGVGALGQAPALFAYAWFGSDLAAAGRASLWSSLLLLLFIALILGGKRIWARLMA
jgi:uncharacterized membrane protein YdjX (TVP38/TMEM64 family)